MTGGRGFLLALAALLVLCSSADAGSISSPVVEIAGGVHVTFAGDPARNCTGSGTCAYSGTIDSPGQAAGGSFIGSFFGGGSSDLSTFQSLQTATVSVTRSDSAGSGTCTDEQSDVGAGVEVTPAGKRLRISLTDATNPSQAAGNPLNAEQCAGPRAVAFPPIPARYATIAAARRGVSVPLTGSGPFADGPFSGTMTSTIVARVQIERTGSFTSTPTTIGGSSTAPTFVTVTLHLQLAADTTTLPLAFAGSPSPFCAPLDACGLTGTVALTTPPFMRRFTFDAEGIWPAGAKRSRDAALQDLRAGRLALSGEDITGPMRVATSESVLRVGAPPCTDTVSVLVAGPDFSQSGRQVTIAFGGAFGGAFGEPMADPLRTRCPGPASPSSEALGQPLISASTTMGAVLAGHPMNLTLEPDLTLSGTYSGSLAGALPARLTSTAPPSVSFG